MTFPIARIAAAMMLAAGLASATVVGSPGLAAERSEAYDAGGQVSVTDATLSRTISMGIGKSLIVDLPRDASEIFVGNPKVANAVVRSARKLYIVAMDNGQTSIFAMDKDGRQFASFQISVGRDVAQLQQILRTALPRSNIAARTVADTIILTGTVDNAGDAQQALDIAKGFLGTSALGNTITAGQVVNSLTIKGKDQVMLKVSIVEIQRTILKELGVNTNGTWSTGSFSLTNPLTGSTGTVTNTFGSAGNTLQVTLNAFERYGVSHVLAEPTVTAISGENAKFTAGGEIPVPSSIASCPTSGANCVPGVEYKTYGVTLNFAPVVLSEGRILLRLATEVTEVDPDRAFTYLGSSVPAFRTRKNETSVELPSGGSIVSAGLLQSNNRQIIAGLPALMNLPVLGTLFRSRDYQRDETELMIVVTPYIARALNPEEIARPDDGFADPSDPQGWFLGRVNRLYSTTSNPQALQNFRGKVGFIAD